MASLSDWKIPSSVQPKPEDYRFDLDHALSSVVGVRPIIPADAFTADTLGTERTGNGVLIRADGLVLTIGYIITEAETVWLSLIDGRAVQGHVLGYDQVTGFGLIQALARLDLPALPIGEFERGAGRRRGGDRRRGRAAALGRGEAGRPAGIRRLLGIRARRRAVRFAGASALGRHGADRAGAAICSASARCSSNRRAKAGSTEHINMVVPIDLLKPILDDLQTRGQPNRPPRPWLGLYATEIEDKVVVVGLAKNGPAQRADLRTGDIVLSVGGTEVRNLAGLFRRVWSLGQAGVEVPLRAYRDGKTMDLRVKSGDRNRFLKAPRLH